MADRLHDGLAILLCIVPALLGAFSASAGETLDRIRQSGVMVMPWGGNWPPYSMQNENGEYGGFDVEVAREVARRIGVELKLTNNPDGSLITWEEQTSGHWGGKYDVVIGSMTPTAKRDENLDFPVNYYYALGALAVHVSNTTIMSPADASGKRIGALKTANYEMYLRRQDFGIVGMPPVIYKIDNPIVVTFDQEEEAFNALAKGDGVELDGLVNYLPVIMTLIERGWPFKIVGQPLYRVPQAVAIQPGDPEFADLLKETVEGMHADETLKRLSMKYFDFDLTQP